MARRSSTPPRATVPCSSTRAGWTSSSTWRASRPPSAASIQVENEAQTVGDLGEALDRQAAQALHEVGPEHLLDVVDVRDRRLRQARLPAVEADVAGQAFEVETAREGDDEEGSDPGLPHLVRLHDHRRA